MPAIVVLPGLILFAQYPEVLQQPWSAIRTEADRGYVHMLQTLIPVGLRSLFLAAIFGAIRSAVNSVLNSTDTIFTLDIYKRLLNPNASEKHFVRVGMGPSVVILAISIVLAGFINRLGGSLFVYIQTLYAFFAPPFIAVFLLGVFLQRINGAGNVAAIFSGFGLGIAMKIYIQQQYFWHPTWIEAVRDASYYQLGILRLYLHRGEPGYSTTTIRTGHRSAYFQLEAAQHSE